MPAVEDSLILVAAVGLGYPSRFHSQGASFPSSPVCIMLGATPIGERSNALQSHRLSSLPKVSVSNTVP